MANGREKNKPPCNRHMAEQYIAYPRFFYCPRIDENLPESVYLWIIN